MNIQSEQWVLSPNRIEIEEESTLEHCDLDLSPSHPGNHQDSLAYSVSLTNFDDSPDNIEQYVTPESSNVHNLLFDSQLILSLQPCSVTTSPKQSVQSVQLFSLLNSQTNQKKTQTLRKTSLKQQQTSRTKQASFKIRMRSMTSKKFKQNAGDVNERNFSFIKSKRCELEAIEYGRTTFPMESQRKNSRTLKNTLKTKVKKMFYEEKEYKLKTSKISEQRSVLFRWTNSSKQSFGKTKTPSKISVIRNANRRN